MPPRYFKPAICLFLILVTVAVFWQVKDFGFISYDDRDYVTENFVTHGGLTLKGLRWAATTFHAGNWHPLTWLSLMVDGQLFGLDPRGYHLTNLAIHAANTALLFLLLVRLTGVLWPGALVAALFALHPLHVESVAWVSERKDVLSTFFFLTTLMAYAWYTAAPSLRRYLVVFFSFALGLMAKPMLVTLPFVLLLLDYWPLGRLAPEVPVKKKRGGKAGASAPRWPWRQILSLVREKVPLLALAAISCVFTLAAQKKALVPLELTPLSRIGNALVAYLQYLGKMVFPLHLAIFYPHPGNSLPWYQAVAAGLFLGGVSYMVLKKGREYPYLPVGWFWYLGTLVPVIGLVQVGLQAMADRYTYIPLIGIFIIFVWGAADIASTYRISKFFQAAAAGIILSVCAVLTWIQVGYWRGTGTVFEHALQVTNNNFCAYANLIELYASRGQSDKAQEMFARAIGINPSYSTAYSSMGAVLANQGNYEKAIPVLRKALQTRPDSARANNNLGVAYARLGEMDKAMALLQKAIKIDPYFADAYNNLGIERGKQGDLEAAIALFKKAIDLNANSSVAYANLGFAYAQQEKFQEAAGMLREALRIDPDNKGAKEMLSRMPEK